MYILDRGYYDIYYIITLKYFEITNKADNYNQNVISDLILFKSPKFFTNRTYLELEGGNHIIDASCTDTTYIKVGFENYICF